MVSYVLESNTAVRANIAVMRTFVRLREIVSTLTDLMQKLEELEQKYETHDGEIRGIFQTIRQLITTEAKPNRHIGFEGKGN